MRPTVFRILILLLLGSVSALHAQAHDLPYALVEIHEGEETREVRIFTHVPALVLGVERTHLTPAQADHLTTLPDNTLARRSEQFAQAMSATLYVAVDGVTVDAPQVTMPTLDALRQDALITADMPRRGSPMRVVLEAMPADSLEIALPPGLGRAVIVLYQSDAVAGSWAIGAGEVSHPIPLSTPMAWQQGFLTYLEQGILHIVPLGVDHILFVLALVLGCQRFGRLVLQLSVFTLAHSVTLAMAALGWVNPPSLLVEITIALSISALALSNLRARPNASLRLGLIFVFGLIHGLGFAGALGEFGLPAGQELTALIAFNLGVEVGQIAVVVAALICIASLRQIPDIRKRALQSASIAIAAMGLFWTVERVGGALA